MPPSKGHPVYGSAAIAEAERLLARNRQAPQKLDEWTQRELRAAVAGCAPLSARTYQNASAHLKRVEREGQRPPSAPAPAPYPFLLNLRGLAFGERVNLVRR